MSAYFTTENRPIIKPIFIIGAGRSGSTVFHRILCEHPNIAWLSSLCERYPNKIWLNNYYLRSIGIPILGKFLTEMINASEAYNLWDNVFKGFRRPFRDLKADDVTNKTRQNIINTMSKMLTNRRQRLLIKITGWPRIGFIREIFNDAKFIHIIRDGRAVANSAINRDFWKGWQGPKNWRWGELLPDHEKEWIKFNRSFIILAAIQWKILMDACEDAKKHLDKANFKEIKYEEICSNTVTILKETIEFADLKWSPKFERSIKNYKLKNQNDKWRNQLTTKQQNDLEKVLKDYLEKYNYQ